MLASKTTAASSPIMNFIVRPQLSLSGREARRHVMRVVSVLPVGYFVQMPDLVQIKFTSSVAGALHSPRPYPEPEQDLRSANGRFPVDRPVFWWSDSNIRTPSPRALCEC